MNSFHHPIISALPLIGALLLSSVGRSAECFPAAVPPSDLSVTALPSLGEGKLANTLLTPPPRKQMISSRLAANLASRLPAYASKLPQAERPSAGESTGAGEMSGDNEAVFLLPKIVVRATKSIVLRERDISTARGVVGVALNRYSSQVDLALNHFRLPIIGISPEARALAFYAEAERLKERSDLERSIRIGAMIDRVEGAEMKRLKYAANH